MGHTLGFKSLLRVRPGTLTFEDQAPVDNDVSQKLPDAVHVDFLPDGLSLSGFSQGHFSGLNCSFSPVNRRVGLDWKQNKLS